jgi:hypothetical protein
MHSPLSSSINQYLCLIIAVADEATKGEHFEMTLEQAVVGVVGSSAVI